MILTGNTHHWLYDQAQAKPLNHAVITEDESLSYKELHRKSLNAAGYFSSFDIGANENIGILYRHNYNFYVIVNALWLLGAVPVPLNTKLTVAELSAQIKHAGIKHLIVDEYNDNLFNSPEVLGKITYSHNSKGDNLSVTNSPLHLDKPALLMYTSGSSGKPKAVIHTFTSLLESVKIIDSFASLSEHDVLLASLPLYHVGGFMMLVRAILTGASVAFPESLQFEDICDSIANLNPSLLSIIPTTLLRMCENEIKPNNKLRYAFLGGGPSSENTISEGIKKGWPVVKVYGSTETCSMVTALAPHEATFKPNSSGKAMLNVQLKIKDDELLIKSLSLFKEYYNDKAVTHDRVVDGYYHTGDFANIDKDGHLYIEARREDIIVSGGENISVMEVETAIKQIEFVDDVSVFPYEDLKWGQIVCAVIKLKKGGSLTSLDVKEFLTGLISSYKIPKKIVFIDEIPRTEMGKTIRMELIEAIKKSI